VKKVILRMLSVILIFSVILLNGCYSTSPLIEHDKWIVRGPAKFGEGVGALIVACAIEVPFLALTLATGPLAPGMADPMGKAAADVITSPEARPFFRVVEDYITVPLFGGIPWLLFGWWGNEEDEEDFNNDEDE